MNTYGICDKCGNIHKELKYSLCPKCSKEENNEYTKIKEFIRSNPRSNAIEVSLGTGVSIEKITKYIKEKSFTLNSNK